MSRSKEDVARELVEAHFRIEPALSRVFLIRSGNWDDPREPIKLLEINTNTVPTGSVEPYVFAPTESTPYQTIIAEITPEEFERLQHKELALPSGWSLEDATAFERPRAA